MVTAETTTTRGQRQRRRQRQRRGRRGKEQMAGAAAPEKTTMMTLRSVDGSGGGWRSVATTASSRDTSGRDKKQLEQEEPLVGGATQGRRWRLPVELVALIMRLAATDLADLRAMAAASRGTRALAWHDASAKAHLLRRLHGGSARVALVNCFRDIIVDPTTTTTTAATRLNSRDAVDLIDCLARDIIHGPQSQVCPLGDEHDVHACPLFVSLFSPSSTPTTKPCKGPSSGPHNTTDASDSYATVIAKHLLEKRLCTPTAHGGAILMTAARHRTSHPLRLLLGHMESPLSDRESAIMAQALRHAIRGARHAQSRLLVSRGAMTSSWIASYGRFSLLQCVVAGDEVGVRILVDGGVVASDAALEEAVKCNRMAVLQILVRRHRASSNSSSSPGVSASQGTPSVTASRGTHNPSTTSPTSSSSSAVTASQGTHNSSPTSPTSPTPIPDSVLAATTADRDPLAAACRSSSRDMVRLLLSSPGLVTVTPKALEAASNCGDPEILAMICS